MLRSLIAACLSRRPLVLISFVLFLGLGYAAFTRLNIEAYPDPTAENSESCPQQPRDHRRVNDPGRWYHSTAAHSFFHAIYP